mgnify:CR=1 FL=1
MSKTFKEFLVDNPTLYNGVGYYDFNNVTQEMDFIEIDEITKTFIFDWFQDREVNSDTHFARDFKRELNKDLWQYYQFLRVQLTDFDPLVADYFEDYVQHVGENHETGKNDQTKTPGGLLKQRTTTYNNEQVAEGGKDTIKPNTTSTQTTERGITEETKVTPGAIIEVKQGIKQVDKAQPVSLSYSGATAGEVPDLDWHTASSQSQNEQIQVTTPKGGNDTTLVTPGDGQDVVETKETGTKETEYGKTSTRTGGHTEVEALALAKDEVIDQDTSKDSNDAHENKRRHTGRTGMLPQWALQKAREYIAGTTAYDFLYNALQPCFNWVDEL